MKINEMMKRTGLKLAAIIVIGGVLMFTFTGCNKPAEEVTETVAVETVVEMEDTGAVAGGLYAEEATIEDGQEAEVAEEYTIDFVDAGNEDIVAESQDMVTLPEYERQRVIDLMQGEVFGEFTEDSEDFEILEITENEDGSKTYLLEITNVALTNGCTTQYSVDENGNAKALFVYKPVDFETKLASDFGINFEVKVNKEGNISLEKIIDLFGNDVSDITLYVGDVVGWSMSKYAVDTDFVEGDELSLSQNLDLYPVIEGADNAADIDTSEGFWVIGYTGVPVQVGSSFNENDLNFEVVDGEVLSIDGTKQVNQETGEITETPADTKGTDGTGQETGSTTGTAAPTGGEEGINDSSTTEDIGGVSAEEFSNFWGVPVGNGTTNPNSTGGSNGAIQW